MPSRVAVGFTPGDVDPSDPELYRVKGKHAHAWPEVWLWDAGWVPFECPPVRRALEHARDERDATFLRFMLDTGYCVR